MPEAKYRFTFGKHKGKLITEVPSGYIIWINENTNVSPELKQAIAIELSRRYALPDPEERKRVREAIKNFCSKLVL